LRCEGLAAWLACRPCQCLRSAPVPSQGGTGRRGSLGGSALRGRAQATGRPAMAAGARASPLRSRRAHRL
jgi:hypothetical protein